MQKPERSKRPLSVDCVLHVYGTMWEGPRPGIPVVVFASFLANINVTLDGVVDAKLLAEFRRRPQGNTIAAVDVYEALDPEQRDAALRMASWRDGELHVIAEWPN